MLVPEALLTLLLSSGAAIERIISGSSTVSLLAQFETIERACEQETSGGMAFTQ